MRGYVRTPAALIDRMVKRLMRGRRPSTTSILLDPGCGDGAFLEGVLRYCDAKGILHPALLGVELNPSLARVARNKLGARAKILNADFLLKELPEADYVVGNPPYVSIANVDERRRAHYKSKYAVASGRFDTYMLFFERAMQLLRPNARLVFVTPEKFQYVNSAAELRRRMASLHIASIEFLPEETFPGRVTYPVITTIERNLPRTTLILRNGNRYHVRLAQDGSPWTAAIRRRAEHSNGPTLADICDRISCGVATGLDQAFVLKRTDLLSELRRFAHPTISGRQMNGALNPTDVLLAPYDENGKLLGPESLGKLVDWLRSGGREYNLRMRTCVRDGGKPWYAFHDSFPIQQMSSPKILCKDICETPKFQVDQTGTIVPRHSVYYLVPSSHVDIHQLVAYLNGPTAREWLASNAQRASRGFLRLQSHVLKRLPVPSSFLPRSPRLANDDDSSRPTSLYANVSPPRPP